MGLISTEYWRWLEKWRAPMFLAGGGAGLLSAVLFGLDLLDVPAWWRLWALAQTLEYLFPFVGLLGIYPELRGRAPRLARVGLVVACVAITFLVVNRVLLGLIGHDRPFGIVLVMVAAMIFGFLVFGITSLRTSVPSQLLGLLMVVVAAMTLAYFGVFVAPVPRVFPTAANVTVAVTLLAIGYLLSTRSVHPDRPEPSPVPTS